MAPLKLLPVTIILILCILSEFTSAQNTTDNSTSTAQATTVQSMQDTNGTTENATNTASNSTSENSTTQAMTTPSSTMEGTTDSASTTTVTFEPSSTTTNVVTNPATDESTMVSSTAPSVSTTTDPVTASTTGNSETTATTTSSMDEASTASTTGNPSMSSTTASGISETTTPNAVTDGSTMAQSTGEMSSTTAAADGSTRDSQVTTTAPSMAETTSTATDSDVSTADPNGATNDMSTAGNPTTAPSTMADTTNGMTTMPAVTTDGSGVTQPVDSGVTQGNQATNSNDITTASQTTMTPTPPTVSISAVVTIRGENFTEALGNTSSSEFMTAKTKWEEKLRTSYCDAIIGNRTCNITIVVTGFSGGSIIVDYIVTITALIDTAVNEIANAVLNTTQLVIFDDSGNPYNLTISGLTVLTTEAPATTGAQYSNLTCFACSTSDLKHACYTGGSRDLLSAVSTTELCGVGESCLTFKNMINKTHTSVVRKCASTATYCDDTNTESESCREAQQSDGDNMMECRRCCSTNTCNYMDAGSSRPIPALILMFVAVFIARAM